MKTNNPRQNLGGNLADGVEITAREYRNNAPNDKSYFVTVLGINRKFIDSVPSSKQNKIIEKYHIPEVVEEGENNYYTIQINGEYYCVRQEGSFSLYDEVMAYLPNGDWSRMYIDYPATVHSNTDITIPQTIVSETEPEGEFHEGDWWDKIDSDGNIMSVYCYLPNSSTGELEWILQYKVAASSGGGVGKSVGNHSEIFNDYSGNQITDTVLWDDGYNHAEGQNNTITNCKNVHASGRDNTIEDSYDTIISGYSNGIKNTQDSMVCGNGNVVDDDSSLYHSLIIGQGNTIVGSVNNSIVAGSSNTMSMGSAILLGYGNTMEAGSFMCGMLGENLHGGTASGNDAEICVALRDLVFYVEEYGAVYAAGGYNAIGADYAEYFEWADGNPENEDRRGMLVSLDGDKIVPAHGDNILGAVSANPSIMGNCAGMYWHGKYKTDVFGCVLKDKDGMPILSDDYDDSRKYVSRQLRPEWAAVGLVGRLIVTDNGKCVPDGYVSASNGMAIPTSVKTNVRMLRRVDSSHIEVLIK